MKPSSINANQIICLVLASRRVVFAITVLGCLAVNPSVSAQVIKQNTTTMNTVSDWSAAPTISVDGRIGGAVSAANLAALTLGGNVSLNGIQFDQGMLGPMTVNASPGFTLTLGATGLSMSGTATTTNSTFDVTINSAIAGTSSPIVVKTGRTITLGGGATSLGNLGGLGTVSLTSASSKNYTFANDRNLNAGSFSSPTSTGLVIGDNSVVSVSGAGAADIGDAGNGVVRVNGTGASLTMGGASADAAVGRSTGLGLLQIDNGSVSVGRNLQVGQALTNSGARGSLIVNGGTLAVTSLLNISISTTTGSITPQSVVEINGGQVSASQIRLNNSSSAGHAQLTMTGGTLYLSNNGSGIDAPGTGSSTYNITLSGGTIGSSTTTASGGWTSAANMTLGTTNGDITFQSANSSSAARNITLSGQLSGAGGLIKTGAGNLTLSGINTYAGATTINAGTLQIAHANALGTTGNISFGGGTLQYGSGITTDLSSRLKNSASAIVVDTVANNVTFSNAIDSTNTSGLTKTGIGTLTLNNANTYSGETTVSGGILSLGNSLALQNSSLDTAGSVSGNGTAGLKTTVTALTFGGLTGNKNLASVFTTTSGGYDSITSLTLNPGSGVSNSYSGNIANGAAGMSITKTGLGTQVLSGNNSYSGGTTLSAGTLVLANTSAAGNGTITQTDGTSVLKLDTTGTIANNMSIYNVRSSQNATLSGAITVNNAVWDIEDGDTLTVSGQVSGSGGLIKNGTGTLVLSGSNSYSSGTTVNSGTLNAANANALGTNATITVTGGSLLVGMDDAINDKDIFLNKTVSGNASAAQASLAFDAAYSNTSGTAGSLTLNQDSIIDLGTGGVVVHFAEIANLNSYILHIFNWEGDTVWSGTPGGGKDQFYVDQSLSDLELNNIRFYSGLTQSSFLSTGFQLGLGSGFQNEVIAVPEPETWLVAVLLLAGSGVTWARSQRQSRITSHWIYLKQCFK